MLHLHINLAAACCFCASALFPQYWGCSGPSSLCFSPSSFSSTLSPAPVGVSCRCCPSSSLSYRTLNYFVSNCSYIMHCLLHSITSFPSLSLASTVYVYSLWRKLSCRIPYIFTDSFSDVPYLTQTVSPYIHPCYSCLLCLQHMHSVSFHPWRESALLFIAILAFCVVTNDFSLRCCAKHKYSQEWFDTGNINKIELTPEDWLEQIKCLHSVFFLNKKL